MIWSRRTFTRSVLCALVAATTMTVLPRDSHAEDDVPYVDCPWSPYHEAWACDLPATFVQGRFAAPPDFRHDADSEDARKRAWVAAQAEPGARARGRMGVFIPKADAGWRFVPGSSWSPGDPVFLAKAKPVVPK
jgi:hypothetical protein